MKQTKRYYIQTEKVDFFNEESLYLLGPAVFLWAILFIIICKIMPQEIENMSTLGIISFTILLFMLSWVCMCGLLYLIKINGRKQWVEI